MRRLLFIAHRLPHPPDKGERLRAFHALRALAGHFEVALASLVHRRPQPGSLEALRRWCTQIMLAPAGAAAGMLRGVAAAARGRSVTEGYFSSRRLSNAIASESRCRPFDVVLGYCSSMLPYVLAAPAPVRALDLVDVDSEKWASYAAGGRRPLRRLYRREARAVRELERLSVQKLDAVFVTTEVEARLLSGGSDRLFVVGNGVDADYFTPTASAAAARPSLVFTGTMDYRPNAEAVCWFAREVWPELKRRASDLTFTIVGRNPTRAVRRLGSLPGINVTGTVADTRPYLASAAVAVCPMRTARGVQNKVLEAMAMERPVVASSAALEGLDAEPGADILRADTPEQWHKHVLEQIGSPEARAALGRRARACVVEKYNWAAQMAPLVSVLKTLSGEPDAEAPTPASRARRAAEGPLR
jgi:sugar transferase (PEP-CTERM/EpsH1 system associated)